MHEWALAEAVIKTSIEIAEKEGLAQVTEVTVKIGNLQQVERPILRFALSQLRPSRFKDAKFRIFTAKTTLKCRVCGNTWVFNKNSLDKETVEAIHFVPEVAHTYIKCPKCGSPDFEIEQGRGIWLETIKGVK
ncbi:MAG: hydrogenase nickel incorporation protein HypA [Candidatus Bathyarchaeota archaeon]|nr:hydrogenase nickel incorporation protein HypA [Candidatus Bathyarchaeota archaeon]